MEAELVRDQLARPKSARKPTLRFAPRLKFSGHRSSADAMARSFAGSDQQTGPIAA